MNTYFEERERAPASEREQSLLSRLLPALEAARERAPAIARQLQNVDVGSVRDRQGLSRIPVVRKSELLQAQLAMRQGSGAAKLPSVSRIFGGFSAIGWGEAVRVFASPGPIYEPESKRPDYWGFARALYAAGFRPGELVHNSTPTRTGIEKAWLQATLFSFCRTALHGRVNALAKRTSTRHRSIAHSNHAESSRGCPGRHCDQSFRHSFRLA